MISSALIALSVWSAAPASAAQEAEATTRVEAGVAWYGDWDAALAEAQRSQRPIMLQFVRPACQGVSGVF